MSIDENIMKARMAQARSEAAVASFNLWNLTTNYSLTIEFLEPAIIIYNRAQQDCAKIYLSPEYQKMIRTLAADKTALDG
jgi:hypothetical protein